MRCQQCGKDGIPSDLEMDHICDDCGMYSGPDMAIAGSSLIFAIGSLVFSFALVWGGGWAKVAAIVSIVCFYLSSLSFAVLSRLFEYGVQYGVNAK